MDKIYTSAILPDIIPSTILYVIKPMLFLQGENKVDFRVSFSELSKQKDIDRADVVIFCRNTEPGDLFLLRYARKTNKKVIYELDDNFFKIDPDTPLGKSFVGRHYLDPDRTERLGEFLSLADSVRVYSEPLLDEMKRFNSSVVLSNGYFDFSLIHNVAQKKRDSKIRLTYATSRGTIDYLQPLIIEAVDYISDKYGNKVEFHIFGSRLPLKKPNIFYIPFTRNYDRFIKSFYRKGCVIGLAPMEDDLFHRSKTNIKYREYGACGIAGIYSDVSLYHSSIQHGVNGLLVDNSPAAWCSAIERLILDPALRETIKNNASQDVFENCQMPDYCYRLFDHIQRVISHRSPATIKDLSHTVRGALNPAAENPNAPGNDRIGYLTDKLRKIKKYGLKRFIGKGIYYMLSVVQKINTTVKINFLKHY